MICRGRLALLGAAAGCCLLGGAANAANVGYTLLSAAPGLNTGNTLPSSCVFTTNQAVAAGVPMIGLFFINASVTVNNPFTDSAGNLWVQDGVFSGPGTTKLVAGHSYNANGLASGGSITATWAGGTTSNCAADVFATTNLAASSPFDGAGTIANGTGTSTTVASTGFTPGSASSGAPESLLAITIIPQGPTTQTIGSFTPSLSSLADNKPSSTNRQGMFIYTENVTTNSSVSYSATLSANTAGWGAVVLGFKSASGAPPPPTSSCARALRGVGAC